MKEEYHTYQLIDRYLKNELSSHESDEFEKRLQSDDAFAETVNLQKLSNELIVEERFFRIMDEIDKPYKGSALKKGIILSGVVLFLISGIYFITGNTDKTSENIQSHTLNKEQISGEKEKMLNSSEGTGQKVIRRKEKNAKQEIVSLPADTNIRISPQEEVSKTPDNIIKEENPVIAFKEDKCGNVLISAEAVSSESCEGDSTGRIEILLYTVKGGQEPYVFSLKDEEYQAANIFEHLLPGRYDVKIKDRNGCITLKKDIAVKTKSCLRSESFSFNPYYGELWKFPAGDYQNFRVRISNKEGTEVYRMEVKGGSPSEWNGTSSEGGALPSGTYFYVIEFPDGKTNQGSVSILQ
jgi:hypothetical protein